MYFRCRLLLHPDLLVVLLDGGDVGVVVQLLLLARLLGLLQI